MTRAEFVQRAVCRAVDTSYGFSAAMILRRAVELADAVEDALGEGCWDSSSLAEALRAIEMELKMVRKQEEEES